MFFDRQSLEESELSNGLDYPTERCKRASLSSRARRRQVEDLSIGDLSLVGLYLVVGDLLGRGSIAALIKLNRNAVCGFVVVSLRPGVRRTSLDVPLDDSLAVDFVVAEVRGSLHPGGLEDATAVRPVAAEAAIVVFGVVQVQLVLHSVLVAWLVFKVVRHSAESLPPSVVEIDSVQRVFGVAEVVVERAGVLVLASGGGDSLAIVVSLPFGGPDGRRGICHVELIRIYNSQTCLNLINTFQGFWGFGEIGRAHV